MSYFTNMETYCQRLYYPWCTFLPMTTGSFKTLSFHSTWKKVFYHWLSFEDGKSNAILTRNHRVMDACSKTAKKCTWNSKSDFSLKKKKRSQKALGKDLERTTFSVPLCRHKQEFVIFLFLQKFSVFLFCSFSHLCSTNMQISMQFF